MIENYHPSEYLIEYVLLSENTRRASMLGLTPLQYMAFRCCLSLATLQMFLDEQIQIDSKLAMHLEHGTGLKSYIWISLQSKFNESKEK
jgi:plasmid maintenance system antidote protein VapI